MYIGSSLVLLALGAIFAFAVRDSVEAIDLITVGYILMAVGVLGLIVSLLMAANNRDRRVDPPRDQYGR